MDSTDPANVTGLSMSGSGGDRSSLDEVMSVVYKELRRLAAAYLRRERPDHTLQPTALVHEAYLRLVKQTQVPMWSRTQFFAISASLMRQILVNHAERHQAAKRGGGRKVSFEDVVVGGQTDLDLIALNRALEKLADLDPRQSRIVELRFFGGLTEQEIAEVLGVSAITVKREWRSAKALLLTELRGNGRTG